ncbi:Calcium-activated chloride channel regulator 2 [Portunus trituberculatus]|uniref:Calcium-activated chloride channel regulator 2 n=1 Tax=Portunus trituberculatus TaxID=210409 RepID=A0A5B7ITW9_PORTR|nr:Calcium-activated chloride channel regulator 2 [Portunus trituberculatus]
MCRLWLVAILTGTSYATVALESEFPVTIKDNGYRNVLVAISSTIDQDEAGDALIEDIKNAMTELSKAMKRATRERLYLAEVTILLPKTWPGADKYQEGTLEKYEVGVSCA